MKLNVNRATVQVGFKPSAQSVNVVVGIPDSVKTEVEQKAILGAAAINKVANEMGMNPDLFYAAVTHLNATEHVEVEDE